MDYVKTGLRFVAKYYFWMLCGLIAVVFLGSWAWTAHGLRKEVAQRSSQLDGRVGAVKKIIDTPNHPNDVSNAAMEQLTESVRKRVYADWDRQYQHQVGILTWPQDLDPDVRAQFEPLRPIEKKVSFPTPISEEVHISNREIYSAYIKQELPKLADIVGANWTARSTAESVNYGTPGLGPAAPASAAASLREPIVLWSAANQNQLQNSRFDWRSSPRGVPTTLQVLYAQEDLWVLKALMMVIQKTNGDADATYNASIKTIDAVEIGRDASDRTGSLQGSGGGGYDSGYDSGDEEDEEEDEEEEDYAEEEEDSGGGSSFDSGGGESADPAEGRYVDNTYQPLPAQRLRAALISADPADAFLAVAKRMPVRMRLQIDQRKLNRFLAECGNSSLPLEVRQVRINRTGTSRSTGYGGYNQPDFGSGGGDDEEEEPEEEEEDEDEEDGGGGGFGGGFAGGFGGGFGADQGAYFNPQATGAAASRTAPKVSNRSPYDIDLEVYGVIYIYNPVDMDKLGIAPDTLAAAGGELPPGGQTPEPTTPPTQPAPSAVPGDEAAPPAAAAGG